MCILDCYQDGIRAYFAFRNSQGGTYGRKLTMNKVLDDELVPESGQGARGCRATPRPRVRRTKLGLRPGLTRALTCAPRISSSYAPRMPEFETILYDERNGVAWVTLNRPDVLHAFNRKMEEELSPSGTR